MTRALRLGILVVVTGACALAACDDEGGAGPASIRDLVTTFRDAYCVRAVACADMKDEATCRASVLLNDDGIPTLISAVDRGIIVYHPDRVSACLADTYPPGCVVNQEDIDPPSCQAMLEGTVAAGGACAGTNECVGHGACVKPASCAGLSCCAGTCASPVTPVPIGGDCAPGTACVAGAFCQITTGTCAPRIVAGASCAAELIGCAHPAFCDIINDPVVCVLPAADGAACVPGRRYACLHGDRYCDPATLDCRPRKAPGAACAAGTECVGYATCDSGGLCAATPALGQPCDDTAISPCLGSLVCTGGACTSGPAPMACLPP